MISKKDVERIARLARLELSEKESENMQKDLSSILDYFEVLKKAAPTSGSLEKKVKKENVVRKDQFLEKRPNLANDLIKAAPAEKDGYIKVKFVL